MAERLTNETELSAQAIWFAAPRTVELRPEQIAPPAADSMRVRTIASAISHGTEMLVYRGEVPPNLPLDLPTLAGSFAFPIKYGYAAVGRVDAVGTTVTHLAPGDLVFVHHPHQSCFCVPAAMAVRLPADLDPLAGLFVANLETAVNILHDTPLRLGETAVVFGQGVVGLLVTHLLLRAGAGRVFAVDPLPLRQDLARQMGATATFAPTADLSEQVRAFNQGRSADVAIEVSGAGAALQEAIEAVATDGTVVVASWYGTKPVTLNLGGHFHRGRVRLRSSQVGQLNPELGTRWDRQRRTETVLDLLPTLPVTALITHRFALADAAAAYNLVDTRSSEAGQVILTYADDAELTQ